MQLRGHTVLYGGSFNPPHVGHQMACLYLLEALAAEHVWLVPAGVHPFGKCLLAFSHRVEMCRLLARPFVDRVSVCTIEGDTAATGRTYDTLVQLRTDHPDRRFAMAIGADILGETPQWYRWHDIQALVPVVVIGRQGYSLESGGQVELPAIASAQIRASLAQNRPVSGLLTTSVLDYISEHGLYRKA